MTTPAVGPPASPTGPGPSLELRVLGEPTLALDGVEVPYPPGRPGRLLAVLVLARGRVVGTDRLVDEVWGEEPPGDARAALHTTVARVRRALGPCADLLGRAPSGYCLDRNGLRLDADDFLARVVPVPGETPQQAVARYDVALSLWRGRAWSGLADDIAGGDALRLEESRLVALEQRAAALLEAGQTGRAVGDLRLLVAEEPLRERGVALLMTALDRSGDVGESLAAYTTHRERLADELGLDPSAELEALHREILRREPDPAAPPLRVVRDAGGAAPPPPGPVLHGREAPLATLAQMLGLHRCVTVVGPGGVGKSALVAHAVGHLPHWWIDLASISNAADLLPAVAEALGAEVFPGVPVDAAVRHRLAHAEGTVVLDNCEHLLGAAAGMVEELAAAGPGVRVLATSRERLAAAGEQVLPLPPLQLPTGEGPVSGSPAVALFLERARAVAPDLGDDPATLGTVAELVRRLDGLPLAIELAAGRVGTITLDDLRERLGDRLDLLRSSSVRGHSRQRTLVSTIEWSYDLLSPQERSAFLRLSVFAGGFDLAAAEAVLGQASPDLAVDLVSVLVERSLLVRPGAHGRGEYRMLETLRSFARERLDPDELAVVRLAHATWVADLVERADLGFHSPEELQWGRRLDAALADVAAAAHWCVAEGRAGLAARIAGNLHRWSYFRLRPDVLGWSLDVLALGEEGTTTRVARCAATYHWMNGEHDAARELATQALALAAPGSPDAARVLDTLCDIALAVGDFDEAMRCSRECYELSNAAGRWGDTAMGACGMVLAATYAGKPAEHLVAAAHRADTRARWPCWTALTLFCEAEVLAEREPQRALAALENAIRLARPLDNRIVLGISLTVDLAVRGRVGPLDRDTVERSCAALEYWMRIGNEHLYLTCLRNLVPLLERFGAVRHLVELVAATSATDTARGNEAVRIDSGLHAARTALGDGDYQRAWATGAARTPDEAGRQLLVVLPSLVLPP